MDAETPKQTRPPCRSGSGHETHPVSCQSPPWNDQGSISRKGTLKNSEYQCSFCAVCKHRAFSVLERSAAYSLPGGPGASRASRLNRRPCPLRWARYKGKNRDDPPRKGRIRKRLKPAGPPCRSGSGLDSHFATRSNATRQVETIHNLHHDKGGFRFPWCVPSVG